MVPTATGQLRELQLALADMLKDFRDVCEKNNLTYFLDFGTLIGAVRHQGFIPWDDDIDVTMPYEDYLKFLEIGQKELGDKYFVQNTETDKYYHRAYTKIRKNDTTFMYPKFAHWNVHQGIWMDVFPIIEVDPGRDWKKKTKKLKFADSLMMDHVFSYQKPFKDESITSKIIHYTFRTFQLLPFNFRKKIRDSMYRSIHTDKNRTCKSATTLRISLCVPRDVYDESTKLIFEGEEYNVPAFYDKKLTASYGDYMQIPPEDQRVDHIKDAIIDLEKNYTFYLKK